MKREIKLHIFFSALPCFLIVIFAVIYSCGIWSLFQLSTVNILCIAFIALELAQAFTEKVNTWKVYGFIGSGAISGIATALNVFNDIQGRAFTLEQLSFWSWLWIGLLAMSIIALVVILIRMFCWNQDQWEKIRIWQQDFKKERMTARQQLKLLKLELLKEKATAKINKQKDQAGKDIIVQNQKHEQRMERLKDWKKYWKNNIASVSKGIKLLGAIIIVLLFLFIPYFEKLQFLASDWLNAMESLAFKISSDSSNNREKFFKAFASYIIMYIFFIAAIWLLLFLCQYVYKILTNRGKADKEQRSLQSKNFLEEYDIPIAILVVFTALMFALGNSESPFTDITNKWAALFTVILLILVIFVSVEIVRLVVEQIGQRNSLLKQLVRLIFVAILEFLTGLLLGVIINFRIEDVISSLLTIIFPQEELSFTSKVQEKFTKMFNRELEDDSDDNPMPSHFAKKYIWRRYHKK